MAARPPRRTTAKPPRSWPPRFLCSPDVSSVLSYPTLRCPRISRFRRPRRGFQQLNKGEILMLVSCPDAAGGREPGSAPSSCTLHDLSHSLQPSLFPPANRLPRPGQTLFRHALFKAARLPMKIRKAVFPVAGLGTRVLPATKAMPKEMLTIVDKPLIQYVYDEAREAGIEHFIFVTGRNKNVIEDHFDKMFELDATLAARSKKAEQEILAQNQPEAGAVSFT